MLIADRYYGDDRRDPEMEFALDVGRRKGRLVSHAAIPARDGGRWPYFISAVWEDETPKEGA